MSGRRRDSGGGHEGGDERWLLTYADMITLLLALFIVLFAMSTIDAKKFENVKHSLSETFKGQVLEEPGSVLDGSTGALDPENANQMPDKTISSQLEMASNATAARFKEEQRRLQGLTKDMNLGKGVQVVNTQKGISVRIAGDALFESGSYDLRPGIRAKLVTIERELAAFDHPIEIAGHTDGAPVQGGNYRLGAERALTVISLFEELRYGGEMQIGSYAATKPVKRPVHAFDSVPENRRIEITVLAPGSDNPDPQDVKNAALALRLQHAQPKAATAAPAAERVPDPVAQAIQSDIDAGVADDLTAQAKDLG